MRAGPQRGRTKAPIADGILIVEHLCNLGLLPATGLRFFAVPLGLLARPASSGPRKGSDYVFTLVGLCLSGSNLR